MKKTLKLVCLLGTLVIAPVAYASCEKELKTTCNLAHELDSEIDVNACAKKLATPDQEIAAAQGSWQKLEAAKQESERMLAGSDYASSDKLEEKANAAAVKFYSCKISAFKAAQLSLDSANPELKRVEMRGQGDKYLRDKDVEKAIAEYRKAADLGDIISMSMLGGVFEYQKDMTQAAYWYQKAAEQGDREAQYNLGKLYAEGQGVSKDKALATKWWKKSAASGYQPAVEALALLQTAPAPERAKSSKQIHIPVMVTLPGKKLAIGKFEVTQAEWRSVMGSNPSRVQGDNFPVHDVSWNDIQEYLETLNKLTGKKYRLPKVNEWDTACAAGGKVNYCGGDDPDAVAWYSDNSKGQPHPVGQKQANAYGLFDMSGNMNEWTDSCSATECALRGGSWMIEVGNITPGTDWSYEKSKKFGHFGFRLARTLP